MAKTGVSVSFSNGTISVNKPKVKIKKKDDSVEWSGDRQFSIVMPGRTVTASQSGSAWLASAGPWDNEQNIKYDVTAPNHADLDPEIEVVP